MEERVIRGIVKMAQTEFKVLCDFKVKVPLRQNKIVKETDKYIEFGDGQRYHKFNTLNDLTNKEWLKFQKSWFILNPKPREEDVLLHPAKFPEELVKEFIEFFTKKGQIVLDPMLGTGSTLVACFYSARSGIGIELLEKYALIAKKRLQKLCAQQIFEGCNVQPISLMVIQGDAYDIDKMDLPKIDYCITSPPYWDMLLEKGFETQEERRKKKLDVYYSDDPRDLGNIHDYDKFLDALEEIYEKVYNILKPKGYLTIIVKNVKKKNKMYPLAWDIGKRLSRFFTLKDERIWCQNDIKLAPYGYGRAWVSNTVHHYCLNFRKEK
jgi:DNA modification methylase